MAKRLKDILDLIKYDLDEKGTLTREQWNGICAVKVTIDERYMRNYWKAMINAGVLTPINGRVWRIDNKRMWEIIGSETIDGIKDEAEGTGAAL